MKKVFITGALALSLVGLTACSSNSSSSTNQTKQSSQVKADFTETNFEKALNDGQELTGKTVEITVQELNPKSSFGYNIEAGEHLNFVSETNPDVKKGDKIIVKATKITSSLGSFIITYSKVN
jgi:PBP1b-binding outer membrane lipoprotein LpoB